MTSYSSQRDLPEQIASIRSFLKHVGVPRVFTVISDGSHTERGIAMLGAQHACVRVSQVAEVACPTHDIYAGSSIDVKGFLEENPTGKKLRMLISMGVAGPTIYCDSDVLFFAGASELRSGRYTQGNYYLPDCEHSLELALLDAADEGLPPVNSGFLLLNEPLLWDAALERLTRPKGKLGYWPEQTVVHLAAHDSHASALDPDRFIVRLDDKWSYGDHFVGPKTVLRHYVGGLKPKMWTLTALRASDGALGRLAS